MKLHMKISLHAQDGTKFFGPGVQQLLLGIRRTGSLRSAAAEMEMAYSKAFRILKTAEQHFGFPLTQRRSGGFGGGGSELTEKAEILLARYEALLKDQEMLEKQLLEKHFSEFFQPKQVIAVIGSGGKSTAMNVLAAQAPGPALVTTTTHIFPTEPCISDPQPEDLVSALEKSPLVCAGTTAKEGKIASLSPAALAAGLEKAQTVIYEADGSRGHPLKLHRATEPVLLPETTAVLVVAGLSALGKTVSDAVHCYALNPHWAQTPQQVVGPEEFLECLLETVDCSKIPYEKVRIFLNQEDACPDPEAPKKLCQALAERGLSARSGNLRENPSDLFDFVRGYL